MHDTLKEVPPISLTLGRQHVSYISTHHVQSLSRDLLAVLPRIELPPTSTCFPYLQRFKISQCLLLSCSALLMLFRQYTSRYFLSELPRLDARLRSQVSNLSSSQANLTSMAVNTRSCRSCQGSLYSDLAPERWPTTSRLPIWSTYQNWWSIRSQFGPREPLSKLQHHPRTKRTLQLF